MACGLAFWKLGRAVWWQLEARLGRVCLLGREPLSHTRAGEGGPGGGGPWGRGLVDPGEAGDHIALFPAPEAQANSAQLPEQPQGLPWGGGCAWWVKPGSPGGLGPLGLGSLEVGPQPLEEPPPTVPEFCLCAGVGLTA